MKSEDFMKQYGHLSREALPTEARQLLERDNAIGQAYSRMETQCKLLRLKKYEQAPPSLEGRVLYRVRTRLEAGDTALPGLRPGWGYYALRVAGWACALALVLGVYTQFMSPTRQPHVAQQAPDINNQFKPIPTSTNSDWQVVREADGSTSYRQTNTNLRLPQPIPVPVGNPVKP
jgi:hypothetical protein